LIDHGRLMDLDLGAPSSARAYRLDWTGNHFLPPQLVRDAVQDAAEKIDFTTKGEPFAGQLCKTIATWLGVAAEQVAVGAGSAAVLDALLRAHPESEIIDVAPNFRAARIVAHRDNRFYQAVAVRPDDHVPSVLRQILRQDESRPRLVILSSPRNPFGTSISADEIRELLTLFSGPLIIDECYADFASSSLVALTNSQPRLHVVRTFSKAWGLANLRLGFVVSGKMPDDFRQKYLLPYAVGELQQRVGELMLTQHSHQVELSIKEMKKERAFMMSALAGLPSARVLASDANYFCIEHPAAIDLCNCLLSHDFVATRLFRLPGYPTAWSDGMRIAVVPRPLFLRVQAALQAELSVTAARAHVR
jgi:histidinol-phosphate aminotransferase